MNKSLIEDFDYIKHNILKKYDRAKVYSRMTSMPRTAEGNAELVSVLEPLVDLINDIDLSKEDNKELLKQFSTEWDRVSEVLPGIYEKLSEVDGAYDDIWEDMQKLEDVTNEFVGHIDVKNPNEPQEQNLQQVVEEVQQKSPAPKVEAVQQPKQQPVINVEKPKVKPKVVETPIQQKTEQRNELIQKIFSTQTRDLPHQNKEEIKRNNVIGELEKIVAKVDRQHAPERFKEMMFDLKKLADGKQVSEDMIGEYREIINNAKKGFNPERSLMDLSAVLYNQIDGLKSGRSSISGVMEDVKWQMESHGRESRDVQSKDMTPIEKQQHFRDATQRVLEIAEKNKEKQAKEQALIRHIFNSNVNE